jgi:stress response protein YsnF
MADAEPEEAVISLLAETAAVSKREVVTGKLRVEVKTGSHEQTFVENLSRVQVDVERIKLDAIVDVMPEMHEEGGVLVIPIVEEILVRRFLLKEEVRIHRRQTIEQQSQTVTLRDQEVVITRSPKSPADNAEPTNS